MVTLDGIAEVIEAAQKLAAPIPKSNGVPPCPPKCESLPLQHEGHGNLKNYLNPESLLDQASNSLQAQSLRRRRNAEIDDILADVDTYEKRRQDESGQAQKSPLTITPPPQMPAEERYKKQGRSRYDKEKERAQRVISRRDANPGGSVMSTVPATPLTARICKCSEASGVGVVLKCSAAFCPTGFFHLECTRLQQQPAASLVWTCGDCSGSLEGSLAAAKASDKPERLEMDHEHQHDDSNIDNDDDELSTEDFNSDDRLLESDRTSNITGRRTASPDDLSYSDYASIFIRVRESSSEEPATLPRAVHTSNEFTPVVHGQSEMPVRPSKRMTPTHSFTAINSDRKSGSTKPSCMRPTSLFSLDGGSPGAETQSTASLPVGWSQVTFDDLAPFILAETNVASYRALSPAHMGMLEEWRAACPISKLLPGQRALNPFHVNSVQTVPLSHLLAMVDAELAHK